MHLQQNLSQETSLEESDIHTFKREQGLWYIYLPEYLQQGWSKKDLQMTDGAHKFLNRMSKGAEILKLKFDTQPSAGADALDLLEHCGAPKGGALYVYTPGKGPLDGAVYWICDLALFVFGDLPPQIYVRRIVEAANGSELFADV